MEEMKNSLKGGLVILNEMKDKLPPSERKIAEFILDQPHEAIHCTATQLGELSSTSSAAVIRLVQVPWTEGTAGAEAAHFRRPPEKAGEPVPGYPARGILRFDC